MLGLVMTLALAAAPAPKAADLSQLGWMEGRWAGTTNGVAMEEHWTSTEGGALLSMHRDVKEGTMVSFEFSRIATTEDGTFYFAQPGGAPATPFRLVEMADKRVVFENKEHDFPQRILFWLDADGALHARIEGSQNGKTVSEEWTWKKK